MARFYICVKGRGFRRSFTPSPFTDHRSLIISLSRALILPAVAGEPFRSYPASITQGQFVQSLTFGRLLQRKEGQRHPTPIFGLGSFFSHSFLSFFALSDIGEQHDPGG